ncbi:MAG TPA: hypothetical protein PLD15_06200 [Mesotoga sp.]|nr:hypothetical protein [Mesotoga sp.]
MAATKPAVQEIDWSGLLDQFASQSGGGKVFYLKPGKNRIRMLPPKGKNPFISVETSYRGRTRTKYLVGAVVPDAIDPERNVDDVGIRAVLLTRQQIHTILTNQTEGFDLFSPAGNGLTIIKAGSGLNTTVTISVTPKPIVIADEVLEAWKEFDLEAVAKDWIAYQKSRAEQGTNGETEEDED